MPDISTQKPINPDTLDWGRIALLKEYALRGGGYIARTIPTSDKQTLSPDKLYYVAALPQANGKEDALTDNPKGGNRVYAWRHEVTRLRHVKNGGEELTWRTVFCHPKAIAFMLGARRFNHTKNYAYNVLDFMTCPPEQLATIRYAVGKGVMRMIRLAQAGSLEQD